MGIMIYRVCVALKELGERRKLDLLIRIGKGLTALFARRVSVGGKR